jgi:hypothetical protein
MRNLEEIKRQELNDARKRQETQVREVVTELIDAIESDDLTPREHALVERLKGLLGIDKSSKPDLWPGDPGFTEEQTRV